MRERTTFELFMSVIKKNSEAEREVDVTEKEADVTDRNKFARNRMGVVNGALMRRKNPKKPKSSSPPTTDPFPDHQCLSLRDYLLASDGFPEQFAPFRPDRSAEDPEEKEQTVLDGLVSTVLSQNTRETNSSKAFALLKSSFPTWQDVLIAESRSVENAIRCGGLAPTKTTRIKSILKDLMLRRGCFCLEYLRELSVDEVKAELSRFKGIGPKTVACLLMFNLQKDDFPVDTHVLRIARAIGWVPTKADRTKTSSPEQVDPR